VKTKGIGTRVSEIDNLNEWGYIAATFDNVYVNDSRPPIPPVGPPYDNFDSSNMIDRTKWWGTLELVRMVDNGELVSELTQRGVNGTNNTSFVNSQAILGFEADLKVVEFQNNGARPLARLYGSLYNDGTGSNTPGDLKGDVIATIGIAEQGSGPRAFYVVSRCLAPNCNLPGEYEFLPPGPVELGAVDPEWYRFSLSWDGSRVTFGFEDSPPVYYTPTVPVAGPPKGRKGIGTRVNEIDDDNKRAYVAAAFDNVVITAVCPTPGSLSNPSPADVATGVPINQILSWASSANAYSYDVYFGSTVNPPFVGNVVGTSYAPSGLNPNTTYYWKIVAKNTCFNSTAGPLWSFTTVPAIPAPPVLALPGNGETGVGLSPTLVWNAPPGAISSYYLQVSADNFTTFVFDGSVTATSQTLTGPLPNETIYSWRVNATNDIGTSGWSDVWTFITQPPYGNLFEGIRGVIDPDDDGDGIDDTWETANLSNDSPKYKTLFVRPKKATGDIMNPYAYWEGFIQLFPDSRPGRYGFADIPPLTNAGIEVVVIGPTCCTDSTNPATCTYIPNTSPGKCHNYAPFDNFNYNPANDSTHPNCDILEIIYDPTTPYATGYSQNNGHTFFYSTGLAWSWDTKGLTPPAAGIHGYKTPRIYEVPLDNYFKEGAYASIAAGQTPSPSACSDPPACTSTSPMNVNLTNARSGLPDDTVEFNAIVFESSGRISSVPQTLPSAGYYKNTVRKRTIAHELGHALLAGSDNDHCADPNCLMYGSIVNWEMQNFGPGECVHKSGGSKDIRSAGVIHNSVHGLVATPAPPTLASPANQATGVATNPTLSWNASTGATSYGLQVSTNSSFSPTVVNQTGITSTSRAISGLLNGTTYYWRVNATNAGGTSAWSDPVRSFTTVVAAPPIPTLSLPLNQTSPTVPRPITFSWNPSTGATSYQLQVSTSSTSWSGSRLKINQSNIQTPPYTESVLAGNTTYYWRVRASNAAGTSAYSSAWTFRTSP
jgi:hypothetical protein